METARKALAQVKKKAETVRKKRHSDITAKIIVGTATCGVSAGARQVVDALKQEVAARTDPVMGRDLTIRLQVPGSGFQASPTPETRNPKP